MKKRRIAWMIISALILTCFFSTGPVKAGNEAMRSASTEVLRMEIGSGDGQIGYRVFNEEELQYCNQGPEAFLVDGEEICILDTVNRRIEVFHDGKFQNQIEVKECKRAINFFADERYYYVIDDSDRIFVYGKGGGLKQGYELPSGIFGAELRSASAREEGLLISVSQKEGGVYLCRDGENWTEMTGSEVQASGRISGMDEKKRQEIEQEVSRRRSPAQTSGTGTLIRIDREGNLYFSVSVLCEQFSPVIYETSVEKYSPEGERLGYAIYDLNI